MKFDIHYLYSAKYAKGIIIGLIALFSLLIVLEWSSLLFTQLPSTMGLVEEHLPDEKQNGIDNLDVALNTALFGIYVPDDLNEDNIKKTILNISLVGIMLSEKAEDSQVIIKSADGEEKSYKINDKIPGGAIIKRIMAQGVLVERNGTLERLILPKNTLNFEPVAKPLKGE